MDDSPPLLSVVVPTHNVASWIGECLASILRQDVEELEVIVVDDHSTDATLDTLERIASHDRRVRLVRADTLGGANARNLGSSLARGKYLIFADGDDIVPDHAYSHLVASLQASGSEMAIGRFLKFSTMDTWDPGMNWRVFDRRRIGVTLDDLPALIRGRACWNKMFVREFWTTQSIQFPEVVRSNDIVPMTTVLTRARSIDVIPEIVYLYRDRPGSLSMTARASKSAALRSYLEQELECLELLRADGRVSTIREYFSLFLRADGWVHLKKFLADTGSEVEDDDTRGASMAMRAILASAPDHEWARVKPGPRLAFLLFAKGRLDLLGTLSEMGTIGRGPVQLSLEAFSQLFADTARLRDQTALDSDLVKRALIGRMLSPLLAGIENLSDMEIRDLSGEIERYRSAFLPDPEPPFRPNERTALRLCREGRIGQLRLLVRILADTSCTAYTVACDGRSLHAELITPEHVKGQHRHIVARLRGTDTEVNVFVDQDEPEPNDDRFSFEIESSLLRIRGTWDFFMIMRESGVDVEFVVTVSHRLPQLPPGRRSGFLVYPVKRRGDALVVVNRGAFACRVIRRAFRREPRASG